MNSLHITNTTLPVVSICDLLAASEPFYHADRITDFHVILYVLEGHIYVTEDEVDYDIAAGELFFLKSGVHHYGKREIPRGTRWYYAHFYLPQDMEIPKPITDGTGISHSTPLMGVLPLPKHMKNLSGTEIETDFDALVQAHHSTDPLRRWGIHEQLFQLLTKIARRENHAVPKPSLSDRICHYLEQHITTPYCSSKLEQTFYLSYKHMTACFKREKGISPQQYHTRLRMEQACKLLRSTLLSISEISEQLGYTDPLYFSRCFHSIIGMSPSEYRKQTPLY